ncbi:MAG: hypothetical protein JSS72_04950 [Armatimonadetes bacterium]|nr:hypothetical protein [Armatimonadota bacterium]
MPARDAIFYRDSYSRLGIGCISVMILALAVMMTLPGEGIGIPLRLVFISGSMLLLVGVN